MKQDTEYKTERGNKIYITRYGEKEFGHRPCVLYIHGFKGFKDWGFVPHMAERISAAGFDVITFNFSHNGIGPDGQSFTELEAFSNNSFSLEKEEAIELIRLVSFSDFFGGHLLKPLGVLGHSRGGGIALLASAASQEVKAVCTWASVSTFDRFSKAQIAAWRKKGFHEVVNSRTGQVLKLGQNMLKDVEKNLRKHLNILDATRDLGKPLMIVHGQTDETVPYFEAEQLNIFADPMNSDLRLIPNGSHTFGAKHPFEEETTPLGLAIDASIEFFTQQLSD